jgi:hypothetical protein
MQNTEGNINRIIKEFLEMLDIHILKSREIALFMLYVQAYSQDRNSISTKELSEKMGCSHDLVTIAKQNLTKLGIITLIRKQHEQHFRINIIPNTDISKSESGLKVPNTDISKSESGLRVPNTDISKSESGLKVPNTDISKSESGLRVPNTDISKSEIPNTDISKSDNETPDNENSPFTIYSVDNKEVAKNNGLPVTQKENLANNSPLPIINNINGSYISLLDNKDNNKQIKNGGSGGGNKGLREIRGFGGGKYGNFCKRRNEVCSFL